MVLSYGTQKKMGASSHGLGPYSVAFPGRQQGAGWELEHRVVSQHPCEILAQQGKGLAS